VLSRAQLQRWEQRHIDRQPGRHADADVDHPVSDIAKRLIAAQQEHEKRGEGHLRALISSRCQPLARTRR